ncbi:MAG: hypothetical protein FWH20_00815 [Oscillospiraceae bacterium]|nr:hypothetical protein [Oscillospiraceae bacterium]
MRNINNRRLRNSPFRGHGLEWGQRGVVGVRRHKELPARHTNSSNSTSSIATLQVHDLTSFIYLKSLHSQIGSCYVITVRLEKVKLYQA